MNNESPSQQMARMIIGYWTSQAIYAAAKFGVADLLTDGARDVEWLAERTSTDADALYRLLRALAGVGIFAETDRRRFELTPMAQLLRSDVNGSQRAFALMSGDEQFQAWSQIAHSIETGETAFEKVFGQPIFEYLAENPEKGRVFDEAMTGIHSRETAAVMAAYDFSGIGSLADIGGGNGSNLIEMLGRHGSMRGILFDLPHVAERARSRLAEANLAERCEVRGGSFFESVPAGADAYLMRHIIHDWDDEKSSTILRNCRAAMSPEARLLVVESVIPLGNGPFTGKFLDLVMLLIAGGKERTEQEYRELFERGGFELTRVVPTETEMSVLEGRPLSG